MNLPVNYVDTYYVHLLQLDVPLLTIDLRLQCVRYFDNVMQSNFHLSVTSPIVRSVSYDNFVSCVAIMKKELEQSPEAFVRICACMNDYLLTLCSHRIIDEIPWRAIVPPIEDLEKDPMINGKTDPKIDFLTRKEADLIDAIVFEKYEKSFTHYPKRYSIDVRTWSIYCVNAHPNAAGTWDIKDVRFVQTAKVELYREEATGFHALSRLFRDKNYASRNIKEICHGLWVAYGTKGQPLFFAVHNSNNLPYDGCSYIIEDILI